MPLQEFSNAEVWWASASYIYSPSATAHLQDCFFGGRACILCSPMARSRPFLDRLLKTRDVATVVPRLPPEVLHRVIQISGLEDSAELVALATPAQLSRILDADVWHGRTPGADEQFDVDRFGLWLEVLMQSGAAVAAEKLIGLDLELVVAGFSRHAAVFDHAAVSSYTTLDGAQIPSRVSNRAPTAEIGGYVAEARRSSAWETIVHLLAFLQAEHSEYFQRLMRRCVRLSHGPREADGFHALLEAPEQDMFDLASDREARREQQGYATAAQARAFMQAARHVRFEDARPPHSPLARAYFRGIDPTPGAHGDALGRPSGLLSDSQPDDGVGSAPAAMAEAMEVLRDAGVLTEEPRGLLRSAESDASRLALIQDYLASQPASTQELAYLANVIVAGCSIQARRFAPQEASSAALAICNLGLEAWPPHWNERELVTAFQVGWTVLHRDVSMYAAERLIAVIAQIRCNDRDIQMRLHGLRRQLVRSVRDATPWSARDALEVIVMLDAPCWAALVALTDECPVLHAAISPSRDPTRPISPTDYDFISERSQITLVRDFMASLPARLMR